MFTVMMTLFAIVILGYIAGKIGYLGGDFDRKLLSDQMLKAYFPHFDYYSMENIDKDIVYQDIIDVDGKAKLFLDNLKLSPAKYIVELRSVDDTLSKFSEQYFVCDIKSKKMPYKSMYWTNIDKTSAQPGETINLYVGSSEKNVSVMLSSMSIPSPKTLWSRW